MSSSTTKRVMVRRYEKEPLAGYVNPLSFVQPMGIELLSAEGNAAVVPYADVKTVDFVREFQSGPADERRVFQTRPKMAGLWVNLRFRDGSLAEGLLPNNLLQLEYYGFTVIPPDSFGNTQKIFVPRSSLLGVEVLGVVGSPLKKRKQKLAAKEQIGLFDEPTS